MATPAKAKPAADVAGAQDKKAPDWERIEADYRAGLLSIREIAAACGVSHVASRIEFVLAAPVSRSQIIDFGTIKYRGIDAGQRYIDRQAWGMSLQFNATRGEWI